MTVGQISPSDMFDVIDAAVNGSDWDSGQLDAVCHVAMLVKGELTIEQVSDIQDDMITGSVPVKDDYLDGYKEAWKTVYRLLF
jgi:hypothetical protein